MTQEAPRTAGEMLARAREFLLRKGTAEPRLEAELLVAHSLGLSRLQLFLRLDQPVVEAEVARARDALVRRGKHEPVAYITGTREFYGRSFRVASAVLVPRPETELLIDLARERAKAQRCAARVADIGTGSGCIAITLALELAGSTVTAVDISAAALELARANAATLCAGVEFVEGDGPESISSRAPFDFLVSNPPYIAPQERDSLAPDVREHEPALALFTPSLDPDHWLRRLCAAARNLLAPSGTLLVELGHRQSERALEIAREHGLEARTHKDFGGLERVLEARASSAPLSQTVARDAT
ncbi:MAG: peptide chain release factor N(5)-glutamine methyltransferase [Planctomycetes bacterium]|nr:peptide chain release factor N(5)-glutamine methyltransferase [Planctomycetota bacterium]